MNIEFLKKLCAANGVSGHEQAVVEIISQEIKGMVDDCKTDALGNLIAHKKGPGKKMMLAGHMDQIGLLISHIDKEGFLRFAPIGGFNHQNLLSQRFVFPSGLLGVVSCERLDDPKDMAIDKLYIDIGAKDKEDAMKQVKVGDVCVFANPPEENGNVFITPALDDRIGCFIMIEALKKLKKPAFDLYFVFTSQEEVGLRGAGTAAFSIEPDYGLAFDVTVSADTPKVRPLPSKMYGGAAIKLKDRSLLCHPVMIRHLEKCAEKGKIKHQYEILEMGGTDSGAIHVSRGGVPSGVISIASRHIHTSNEMCALSDIEDCIALTVAALETAIG
ncbi:MAG: M42 family metallopeptidase [Oscillospiraceae bacterium]|nr:M42 family metallopeptidase [Oscillospiraceae bacterium]